MNKTNTNANASNLKFWSEGALWNLLAGYWMHGTTDTREFVEMRKAKDLLKQKWGYSFQEIKQRMAEMTGVA